MTELTSAWMLYQQALNLTSAIQPFKTPLAASQQLIDIEELRPLLPTDNLSTIQKMQSTDIQQNIAAINTKVKTIIDRCPTCDLNVKNCGLKTALERAQLNNSGFVNP